METVYVNPDDIYPFRASFFNMIGEKFFSMKSTPDQLPSIEEALNKTLLEEIKTRDTRRHLDNLILMAHVAYLTKGNFKTAVNGFNIPYWIFRLYSPVDDGQEIYFVPSPAVVPVWNAIIKKEYPHLEYVSLEDFWNLFTNNQIQYKEEEEEPLPVSSLRLENLASRIERIERHLFIKS